MATARNIGSGQKSPLPNKSIVKTYGTIGTTSTEYAIDKDVLMVQFLGDTSDVKYCDTTDGVFIAVTSILDKIIYVGRVSSIFLKSASDGTVNAVLHSL